APSMCQPTQAGRAGDLAPEAHERIAERLAQRAEPGLVATPLVEALAKDRLAHLLGACGADAALGAVELEACRLERQLAILEDPPYTALKIVHHVLVMDA